MNIMRENYYILNTEQLPHEEKSASGVVWGGRKLYVSPYTTGEPIMIFLSKMNKHVSELVGPDLKSLGHIHKNATEIMILPKPCKVIADGEVFDVPANTVFTARPGCKHSIVYDGEGDLDMYCIFVPSLPPADEAEYVTIIEETQHYIAQLEKG